MRIESWPLAVLVTLLLASGLPARTLDVPEDHDTIQDAIDAADDGDVVLVAPGIYGENLDFLGKAITVESTSGPADTVIDGSHLTLDDERGSVVSFLDREGPDSRLIGFTLENGVGHDADGDGVRVGGGIVCRGSSPRIRDCWIRDNLQGIYASNSSLRLDDCILDGNTHAVGAALSTHDETDVRVENCEITKNESTEAGGVLSLSGEGTVVVHRCWILHNEGGLGAGAIFADESIALTLTRSLIADNTATHGAGASLAGGGTITACRFEANDTRSAGGGLILCGGQYDVMDCVMVGNIAKTRGGACFVTEDTLVAFERCTIADNEAGDEGAAFLIETLDEDAEPATVTMVDCILWDHGDDPVTVIDGVLEATYSCIEGGSDGKGNIDEDPLFVDVTAGNYRVSSDSPCVDAGDPDSPTDGDGSTADMGAFTHDPLPRPGFLRGDADVDGSVIALADGLYVLRWAFIDGKPPLCEDSADVDDSGGVSGIVDPMYLFRWQFAGDSAPPTPGPSTCGRDPTSDGLDCEETLECQ